MRMLYDSNVCQNTTKGNNILKYFINDNVNELKNKKNKTKST